MFELRKMVQGSERDRRAPLPDRAPAEQPDVPAFRAIGDNFGVPELRIVIAARSDDWLCSTSNPEQRPDKAP
jgi:hypothetical protein